MNPNKDLDKSIKTLSHSTMYLEIKSTEELQEATLICEAEGLKWSPRVNLGDLILTIDAELTYGPICLAISGEYIYWVTKEEVQNPNFPSEREGPIIPFKAIKEGLKVCLFRAELSQLLKKYHAEIFCKVGVHKTTMMVYFVNNHNGHVLNEGTIIGPKELLKSS